MAVLWWDVNYTGRSMSLNVVDTDAEETIVYKIKTNNDLEPEANLRAVLPQPYAAHPNNIFMRVADYNITQDDGDPYLFVAEVVYRFIQLEDSEDPENPLSKPPEISADPVLIQRSTIRDVNGDLIVNKAGDPIVGVTTEDPQLTLKISRNEASYNYLLAAQMKNVINLTPWLGFPRGTVKTSAPSSRQQYHNVYGTYVTTDYTFFIDLDGWKKKLLNQGLRELKDGKLYAIKDDKGQEITEPVLLDEDGRKADQDATPIYIDAEVFQELPFSLFNLPFT